MTKAKVECRDEWLKKHKEDTIIHNCPECIKVGRKQTLEEVLKKFHRWSQTNIGRPYVIEDWLEREIKKVSK